MLTARGVANNAFRCAFYEAQDVLADVADVEFIYLKPKKAYKTRLSIQQSIISHDVSGKMISVNVAFQPVELTKEYDLIVFYLPIWTDLLQVSAIKQWKKHCKVSICWLDELWAANLTRLSSYLSVLNEFDHIVLGMHGTVKAASDILKRTCHWVPGAIDAIRFNPYPAMPNRVIDIFSIGRIWDDVHRAFMRQVAQKNLFYVYDTFLASDTQVKDHKKHREMFAEMVKRSRFFFVAPARMDQDWIINGQIEFGLRYFEAAAAGAVMIGQAPDCESFKLMFDWPDVVMDMQSDGSNVSDVLHLLESQPERLQVISRRNVAEVLLRHDWVYRWEKIFTIAGYDASPGMVERKNRLKAMAEQIQSLVIQP